MKWIWLVNSDENTPNTYGDFTDSFTVRFECASPGTANIDARRNAGAKTGSETDNDVSAFFPGDRMMIRISADSQYALWSTAFSFPPASLPTSPTRKSTTR